MKRNNHYLACPLYTCSSRLFTDLHPQHRFTQYKSYQHEGSHNHTVSTPSKHCAQHPCSIDERNDCKQLLQKQKTQMRQTFFSGFNRYKTSTISRATLKYKGSVAKLRLPLCILLLHKRGNFFWCKCCDIAYKHAHTPLSAFSSAVTHFIPIRSAYNYVHTVTLLWKKRSIV